MRPGRWPWIVGPFVVAACLLFAATQQRGERTAATLAAPDYDQAFWKHWGDGRAELAGYELTYERYGEARQGTAVTIFVTETFADGPRVKSEDPRRDPSGTHPVIKLNLMQDFPTGVYDYNLMTSAFVALQPVDGRPAGVPTKISFSSQDWCGQVYTQLLFDDDGVRLASHSYFDGEADRSARLDAPTGALAEDGLLLWARGLAAPVLAPGESREVRLVRSLELARLRHLPLAWETATLSRTAGTRRIVVPAGEYEVEELTVTIAAATASREYPPGGGPQLRLPERSWTFLVEHAPPHRLVRWSRSDGTSAALLGSARLRYWERNDSGSVRALEQLGLQARAPRTP